METVNIVLKDDLNTKDFEVNQQKIKLKERQQFVLQEVRGIRFEDINDDRHKLSVKNELGIIHLDFTPTFNTLIKKKLFTLPDNAPMPVTTLEHQLKNGGSVWLEANQREVWGHWLDKNERVIFDLIGFFEGGNQ